jgi:AraC-like DNA-binding protein
MELLFSSSKVHPRDRFDYWHSAACENIVDHESVPRCRSTFEAELFGGALADIPMVVFQNSPMAVRHDRRHISHVDTESLFVCRQMAGQLALEQDGREVVLRPGDLTLLDPSLPYVGKFPAESKLLVFKVPRRQLEARTGKARGLLMRHVGPDQNERGLTSTFLATVPQYCDQLSGAAAETVRNQMLDLIAVTLTKSGELQGRPSFAQSLLRMKIRATIESRLTDPKLNAPMIAGLAGVSVRYANQVLAEENLSIMRLVCTRRLARCRAALEDPSQTHRPISDIAFAWGFSDMTHFGRKFKAAYGVLPSEIRRK